jgi:hypothetical protein
MPMIRKIFNRFMYGVAFTRSPLLLNTITAKCLGERYPPAKLVVLRFFMRCLTVFVPA